jgi:hypothetical protein
MGPTNTTSTTSTTSATSATSATNTANTANTAIRVTSSAQSRIKTVRRVGSEIKTDLGKEERQEKGSEDR